MSSDNGELTSGDLAIEITADSTGDPVRHLRALEPIKQALAASFKALAVPATVGFEHVAVLEEVKSRRITTWLRVQLGPLDADCPWSESALLDFLAKAGITVLEWLYDDRSAEPSLGELQQTLTGLGRAGLAFPARYRGANLLDLANAIGAWQDAKAMLAPGDCARVLTHHGAAELDLAKRVPPPESLLAARRLTNRAEMIFAVDMPDYAASGTWQLRYGGHSLEVGAQPSALLSAFHRRELDIRPGDALRCQVQVETLYDEQNELMAEMLTITELLEVLPRVKPASDLRVVAEQPALQPQAATA